MRFGYKVYVFNKNVVLSYNKKLKFKPKILVGYILLDNKNISKDGFIFAIDFVQLNYWLKYGVQFSNSFLKFVSFLDK